MTCTDAGTGHFFRIARDSYGCTDEDGGVVPIRRAASEARWRTSVQPS